MTREIPPRIESPCPKSWNGMAGDARRRFCDHCQLHVHNLSEMTAGQRREVLTSRDRICVTYTVDACGALIARERSHWILTLLSRFRMAFVTLAAAVLPFGLSSCALRQTTGKPVPPPDKSAATVPSDHQRSPALLGKLAPPDSR